MSIPINNVTRRVVYAASGTGPYAFTFEILAATDIAVYRDDTLLTLTTDYTVTINANGTGSITLTATPTGATQIAIVGNRTIQRLSDFVTGGDFFANTLNNELDQQTIFAQQNAEGLGRAMQAPQTDPTTINMTLPRAADRANKTLNFDANGNPVAGLAVVANATGAVATWISTPSSANLRAAMTDETGTGALVFATSPTLTTPTINGATVAGDITITGTGRRITGDFSNATVASRVMFQTSTVDAQTAVAALPNGTSQQCQFQVYNNSDPTNAALCRMIIDSSVAGVESHINGSGTYLPLRFVTGGAERLRIDTSGNVGIGTNFSSFTSQFEISNSSGFDPTQTFYRTTNTGGAGVGRITWGGQNSSFSRVDYARIQGEITSSLSGAHTGNLNFYTATAGALTEKMRIDASGNVGIGNTPSVKLDVQGAGTIRGFLTTTDALKLGANTSAPTTTDAFIYRPADNTIALGTGSTERMRIDSSGSVGVGGSSFGSGTLVIFIANRTAAPTSNPVGGGILYVESGALKYRGSSGTVTTIANA